MFLDELAPLFKELTHQPVSFLGGFVSGLFRLNLSEDPVKGWLDQHAGSSYTVTTTTNGSGPQSISID